MKRLSSSSYHVCYTIVKLLYTQASPKWNAYSHKCSYSSTIGTVQQTDSLWLQAKVLFMFTLFHLCEFVHISYGLWEQF